jgi:Dockerin type I domain
MVCLHGSAQCRSAFRYSLGSGDHRWIFRDDSEIMYVQCADPISSGISPFLFSLPYSPNAIEAQLVNSNGTVLATSQISTSLLNQAINALDDTAFAGSPSLQRNDILSGIATLDAQESAGKWIGAQTTLQSILSQLSSDLLDSYNPPSILVYSKSSLIALGNELMQRLVLNTADVNGDGVVNCADLAIVKASFGKKTGQPGFNPIADVNADGIVNVLDLSAVAKQVPAGTVCQ